MLPKVSPSVWVAETRISLLRVDSTYQKKELRSRWLSNELSKKGTAWVLWERDGDIFSNLGTSTSRSVIDDLIGGGIAIRRVCLLMDASKWVTSLVCSVYFLEFGT